MVHTAHFATAETAWRREQMNCLNCLRSMIRLGVEKGLIVWFCVECDRIAKGESDTHPQAAVSERREI
jgi:hypothetical protein